VIGVETRETSFQLLLLLLVLQQWGGTLHRGRDLFCKRVTGNTFRMADKEAKLGEGVYRRQRPQPKRD
jgi:hypothetical protein